MYERAVYRPHPEELAKAVLRPETGENGAWTGLNAQRFEVVSRGDFVPGILYLPDSAPSTPAPLLLLQHDASEAKDSAKLECAAPWVKEGLAVATVDLPLHGERASAKLSERLIVGVRQLSNDTKLDAETRVLVEEFASQATSDLIRSLDALCALPEIDGERVGFMGFGLGAIAGTDLLAHDSRTRVAVFVQTKGGLGAPDALFETAPKRRKLLRVSGDANNAGALSPKTVAEIWRLLSKELGLQSIAGNVDSERR